MWFTASYCLSMELAGAIVLKHHSHLFLSINFRSRIELLHLSHRLARHNNFVEINYRDAQFDQLIQ